VKSKTGCELRDYQMTGFNWLRYCWYQRRSIILADEMGIGKTAQVAARLCSVATREEIGGPFLVVAPLSTLEHWKAEFERWSDLNAVVYHGNQRARDTIRETEFNVVDDRGRAVRDRVQFDIAITNNEMMFQDFAVFAVIEWRAGALKYAHMIMAVAGRSRRNREFEGRDRSERALRETGQPIKHERGSPLPDVYGEGDISTEEPGSPSIEKPRK